MFELSRLFITLIRLKGNAKSVRVSESSSYRMFELSGFYCIIIVIIIKMNACSLQKELRQLYKWDGYYFDALICLIVVFPCYRPSVRRLEREET